MDTAELKEKLIAVLGQIQVDSGLECPEITGATKPVESLPKFDSKVWAVATSNLAAGDRRDDSKRREYFRGRRDQTAPFDRRDGGLRQRTAQKAGEKDAAA